MESNPGEGESGHRGAGRNKGTCQGAGPRDQSSGAAGLELCNREHRKWQMAELCEETPEVSPEDNVSVDSLRRQSLASTRCKEVTAYSSTDWLHELLGTLPTTGPSSGRRG